MIKSMTGYGRAEIPSDKVYGYVEIRSKNHKYRDIKVYLPKKLASFEIPLIKILKNEILRGKIDLNVNISAFLKPDSTLSLNKDLLNEYKKIFNELKEELGGSSSVDILIPSILNDLIVSVENKEGGQKYFDDIKKALLIALSSLNDMRVTEGEALKGELIAFVKNIRRMAKDIRTKRDENIGSYHEKVRDKITGLIEEQNLDESRIYQEIAYIIDKSDITEELDRLRSHIEQFYNIIEEDGAVGKKLDFLFQEMGREINTIASKSNDFDIATFVVNMKNELEKAREQAQNIE